MKKRALIVVGVVIFFIIGFYLKEKYTKEFETFLNCIMLAVVIFVIGGITFNFIKKGHL